MSHGFKLSVPLLSDACALVACRGGGRTGKDSEESERCQYEHGQSSHGQISSTLKHLFEFTKHALRRVQRRCRTWSDVVLAEDLSTKTYGMQRFISILELGIRTASWMNVADGRVVQVAATVVNVTTVGVAFILCLPCRLDGGFRA